MDLGKGQSSHATAPQRRASMHPIIVEMQAGALPRSETRPGVIRPDSGEFRL